MFSGSDWPVEIENVLNDGEDELCLRFRKRAKSLQSFVLTFGYVVVS